MHANLWATLDNAIVNVKQLALRLILLQPPHVGVEALDMPHSGSVYDSLDAKPHFVFLASVIEGGDGLK